MKWSTACPDWAERIVARESLLPCPPLFAAKAEDALAVFKALQVTDLPRKDDGTWPTLGESCDEFVFDLVGAIFGAEDPETGKRLIRDFMLLISKKNAKSTIAAGIMITALILNWRFNAELLILAPTIEVANNSFSPAAGMVRADPALGTVLKVVEHQRQVRHLATGAVLKVVAADSDVVSGNKASAVLVEELWLFGKKPKSEAMLREALGGQASRPEAFVLFITTHSDEPPAGVFKSKLAYFRDVRDGLIEDPTSLGMLFEWPEDMLEAEAYLDPANFYVTNPMLGRSVNTEWLATELRKTQTGEGEALQLFLAKHLNVEIGMRLRRDRWGAADYWVAAGDRSLTLEALLDRCEVAVVGIDGGGFDDLFGLTVLGREPGSDVWLAWSHAWAHRIVLERRKQLAAQLQDYARQGDLTFADTRDDIMHQAAKIAAQVRDSGKLPDKWCIAMDVWRLMNEVIDAFVAEGFREDDVDRKVPGHFLDAGSGKGLSGAITAVEFKLADGMLVHDGSDLMTWCVSNALVKLSGSHFLIDKAEAGSAKIDPVVSLLHAAKAMGRGPVAAAPFVSPYATRGLVRI